LGESVDEVADQQLFDAFQELVEDIWTSRDGLSSIRDRINRLPQAVGGPLAVPTTSRVPGGSQLHGVIGRATHRYDSAVVDRVRALADETRECLLDVLNADMGPLARRLSRVAAEAEAAADAVAALEVSVSALVGQVENAQERLARLEEAERDRGFRPWFPAFVFGSEFRGTRDDILLRYHDIADIVAGTGGPVLDLGCGRGELVELLVSRGVPVQGVEADAGLVDFCRSIYLDVRLADAALALDEAEDGSLGAVTLIQVVEHLTPQQLVDLVPLLASKVRPGGIVVAETVNATSPYVYTRSFYLDPTHTNPIHHAYLSFLFRQAGFRDVEVRWRSPVPTSDFIPLLETRAAATRSLAVQVNAAIEKLNRFLFTPQDYAVVAAR
jgi:2-polyprenyl-3-methyl-5-hydroxy-6-metoxy-1,4-benzoquinol methylase